MKPANSLRERLPFSVVMRPLTILLAFLLAPIVRAADLPRPDHVVVVIEENRSYAQIMDQRNSDSYIHALIRRGMLFNASYGVAHPSQPNYLALFSGSLQGIDSNDCPLSFTSDNLASALQSAGRKRAPVIPP